MARTVLSVALLACLGLAFIQLVSAEQQNQELKNASEQAMEPSADDVQVRLLREADAKKRRKTNKNRKANRKQRKNRNKNVRKMKKDKKGAKKRARKSKKRKKKNGKKSWRNNRKRNGQTNSREKMRQTTCDVTGLCQKIKDYIKYSNQLRKLKRINSTCATMGKKAAKAGEGEFTASGEANADTGDANVTSISDELKNCRATAKLKCETKAINGCMVPDLHVKCMAELQGWISKFGPKQGSCLQSSAECCACINAITPDPSPECLNFEAMNTDSISKKKKCTGSGEKGSFGYCRQLQHSASEKGPAAAKLNCGSGAATTAGAAGRRKMIRNNLLRKWNNQ